MMRSQRHDESPKASQALCKELTSGNFAHEGEVLQLLEFVHGETTTSSLLHVILSCSLAWGRGVAFDELSQVRRFFAG